MRKQMLLKLTALIVALLVTVSVSALAENTDMAMDDMIGSPTDAGYIDLTPGEANQLIADTPDLVIIDVSPLYDEGHVPGALHYYVGDGTLDEAIPMLDMNKTYLVYCHSDAASMLGATKLVEAGFAPVYRIAGNFGAWVDAGYPVSTLTMDEEIAVNEAAMAGMKAEAGYTDLTPEQAKMLIEAVPGLVVVDVSPLYDEGHLPGAVHYAVGDGTLDEAIPMLDMGAPYLVYCHGDDPAILGATKLVEAGFHPVFRLEGNYGAWVDAGFPIEP